ncbi:hypothetical protein [Methanococcus sp. CF]
MVNLIKRYFLFLLILMSVVCSVNAVTCTIPETCTATDYYIILTDDTISQDLVISMLSAYDFGVVAPEVSGINGQTIYFASESDLGRFCSVISNSNKALPFAGAFDVYTNNKRVAMTVLLIDGTAYLPYGSDLYQYIDINASKTQLGYMYSWLWSDYSSNYIKILLNGEQVFSAGGESSNSNYLSKIFLSDNVMKIAWTNVHGYQRTTTSIVLFDYVDYITYSDVNRTDFTITELYAPPERATIDIYSEPAVDVYNYANDQLLGTTDNGGYLAVPLFLGETTLKFVKEGYWDTLETITVTAGNNPELFISLSPKNAIFQISKEFSGNLYPNSVGTLSMDITPIKDAYAAKLRVSGIDVNKVYYKAQELPRTSDGYYILGDVSSTQNIEIEFDTPQSWGEKTFTVEITATDIEGSLYTNLETINYEVLELPFLLEMPETFGIGTNDITLTDMSGNAYSVLMVLYDSDDVEVWSSSTSLLAYCEYTFEVPIDDAGAYTLELNAKSGTVKTYYSIEIIEPVTLITEEITANPGKVATVQFKISNPTSNVKYYTAELSCPFFNESINKTFSISPETVDKTVDISFEVPDSLELENYQLVLEIFDPDKTDAIYSGNVVLTISNESLLFASVPGGNTTVIILAAALILIVGTFAAMRLKK